MIQNLIAPLTSLIGKAIDNVIPDKTQAAKLKADITAQALAMAESELKGAVQIITAEAQGESWLQRNWRPVVMLWFAGLVGAHWLGLTAPNLTEAVVVGLLNIVQVGIGGYVVGRSGEKMMKLYKER